MKALIRFSKINSSSSLETSKYLDNILKALPIAGISYTSNLLEESEIAHFISPVEERQINDAYLEDLLVVISVGYCEGDEKHRFFEYKKDKKPLLSSRSKRILKQADLILVPNNIIKEYLLEEGVEVRIEIVTPGVDIERFENITEITLGSFNKYFQHKKDRPFVISHGRGEQEAINSLKKIALALPSIDFYYFVDDDLINASINLVNKVKKNLPTNLYVSHMIPYDIFLSGIKGALAYLSLPLPTSDLLTILEALASKTQVIYMDEFKKHGEFINRDNVLSAANEEKAQKLIWSLCLKDKKTTIINGFNFALANSLDKLGEQLKQAYESLIK